MRTIEKAFLSCAIVAAAGLLDARVALATGGSCNNPMGGTITVVSVPPGSTEPGACTVEDPAAPACASSGGWTGIEYQVTGGSATDVVSTLVTVNNTVLPNQVYLSAGYYLKDPCTVPNGGGDPTTGLGKYSCHERALRVKVGPITLPDSSPAQGFWVLVKGNKQPIPTTIAQKRGVCPNKTVAILGLGLDIPEGCVSTCGSFNPHQGVKNLQIVSWEGCVIEKHFSPTTGAFLGVSTDTPGCTIEVGDFNNSLNPPRPVTNLTLTDTSGTEAITFADGDATSGDSSCFNTFVGGVYARVCR
jgi:hypothetical protein